MTFEKTLLILKNKIFINMSANKILLKFAKKGINLSPEAYQKVINAEKPVDFASSLIVKLKGDNFSSKDLVCVSGESIDKIVDADKINGSEKHNTFANSQKPVDDNLNAKKVIGKKTVNAKLDTKNSVDDNVKKGVGKKTVESTLNVKKPVVDKSDKSADTNGEVKSIITKKPVVDKSGKSADTNKDVKSVITKKKPVADKSDKSSDTNSIIQSASQTVKDTKIKFKRNEQKTNVKYDFKILQDTSKKSYTSGEVENLIAYFKSRYEKLANILSKRAELKNYTKIADMDDSQDTYNLILMVREIRSSKNGHKIIEFEDDTGEISVLFSNKNEELFAEAEKLVKDEVVGVIVNRSDDSNFAFAQQLINPGVLRVPEKEMDFAIVFLSDVHIGSLTFLEDAFQRFIDWINCEYGSEEQRRVAEDVKYLIIGGDIVDGIGVYPNQEKELAIKDITEQYNEAARFLGNIRNDIKIIIAPGNHDASRVAEPQPAVPEEYAKALYELDNVEFISNPGVVSLDGIKVLIYHGRSFDDLVMAVKAFTHQKNDVLMEELLQKRHLAPIYGERTPLASELEDYLVIDDVPDVFHTGHVHINTYRRFKGIHLINSGTFQTQTEFQKIYNIEPTPAEVPILHKGKYKHFKFI